MQLRIGRFLVLTLGAFTLAGCFAGVELEPSIDIEPAFPEVNESVVFSVDESYDKIKWEFDGAADSSCNNSKTCTKVFSTEGGHSVTVKVKNNTSELLTGSSTIEGEATETFEVNDFSF